MQIITSIAAIEELSKQNLLWRSGESNSLALASRSETLTFKLPEIDRVLPDHGLSFGEVHEFALNDALSLHPSKRRWHGPLFFISHLLQTLNTPNITEGYLLWVGRRLWPTPQLLAQIGSSTAAESDWFSRSLFIDPPSTDKRLWTMLEALRSPAVRLIIGDGSKLKFIDTRKLLLLARKSKAIVLLIRPPWEITTHSSATTKWLISMKTTPIESLRWDVELVRARGLAAPHTWTIELYEESNGTKNLRCIPADSEHRSIEDGDSEREQRLGGIG